jgi:hypothetical protein
MVPLANVHFMVFEVGILCDQPRLIPPGIPIETEKGGPHVVVYTMNLPSFATKMLDHFAAHEAVRARDK